MGNKQNELEKEGFKPLVTYEEAIGYAVGGVLRDKDGVSAAAKMCEIITTLSNENQSLCVASSPSPSSSSGVISSPSRIDAMCAP